MAGVAAARARHRRSDRRLVRHRRPQQARRPLAPAGAGGTQPPARLRRGRRPSSSRGTCSSTPVVAHDVLAALAPAATARAHPALPRRAAGRAGRRCARPHAARDRGAARPVPRRVPARLRRRGGRMTTDPFLELRIRDDAVEPDPAFRQALRDRLAGALDDTEESTMSLHPCPARHDHAVPHLPRRGTRRSAGTGTRSVPSSSARSTR